ncbi:free fatty acid receptor 4-like [Polyodon spathula]|uniref:free fatty acid receptor 4-like n=1 Tax=Polyodon spathula TaxID=7913 RepID=UPI001B7D99B3|nr:free fatty acid receptor 4-like [Polyodon spathula]
MGFNQSYQSFHRDKQSYFTFFNEFKEPNKILATSLETLVLLILFVFSFIGNVSAIVVIAKDKKPVNKNFFVLNLFFADLLFVSTIPLIISIRWTETWALGPFVCHMLFYVMCMSGCVTVITLATISLERMIAILKLHVAPTFNVKLVSSALAFIWIFSAFTSLPLCLFFNVMTIIADSKEVKICTLMWPSVIGEIVWDIAFTGLDFVIPALIIVTSYTKIIQISKSSRRRLQSQVSRQDFKLFRTLLLLMISFFVMWSPIFITVFLILIQNFKNGLVISSSLFLWVVAFTFTNSALNPILYSISHFRHQWRRRLCSFSLLAACKSTDIAIPLQTIQTPQAQLSLVSV